MLTFKVPMDTLKAETSLIFDMIFHVGNIEFEKVNIFKCSSVSHVENGIIGTADFTTLAVPAARVGGSPPARTNVAAKTVAPANRAAPARGKSTVKAGPRKVVPKVQPKNNAKRSAAAAGAAEESKQ